MHYTIYYTIYYTICYTILYTILYSNNIAINYDEKILII